MKISPRASRNYHDTDTAPTQSINKITKRNSHLPDFRACIEEQASNASVLTQHLILKSASRDVVNLDEMADKGDYDPDQLNELQGTLSHHAKIIDDFRGNKKACRSIWHAAYTDEPKVILNTRILITMQDSARISMNLMTRHCQKMNSPTIIKEKMKENSFLII